MQNDSIHSFLIKIPIAFLSFIYIVLLTRIMGPEGMGKYTFVITSLILLTSLLGFNLQHTIAFFVASNKIKFSKIITSAAFIMGIGCALFVVVAGLLYFGSESLKSIFFPKEIQLTSIVVFSIFYFIIHLLLLVIEGAMAGMTQFKKLNVIELYSIIIKVVVLGGVYLYQFLIDMDVSISLVFYSLLFVEIVNFFFYLVPFYKRTNGMYEFNKPDIEEINHLKKYSLQGYYTQNASKLIKRIDVWFIEYFSNLSALGNYSLATQTTNFLLEFIFPIQKVLMPYLVKMEKRKAQKMFFFAVSFSFLFLLVCALLIFISSGFLVPFIFGQAFEVAILPIKILSVYIVIVSIRNYLKLFNAVNDRQKYTIFSSSLELIVIILLDIILIPKFGIAGAAYATLISCFISSLFLLYTAIGELMFPVYRLFVPHKSDFKLLYTKVLTLYKNLK